MAGSPGGPDYGAGFRLERVTQSRVWHKTFQVQTDERYEDEVVTKTGITSSKTDTTSFEKSLGLSAGVDFKVFSASVSAALTWREERSATVALTEEVETRSKFTVNPKGTDTVYVGRQLENEYSFELWRFRYVGKESSFVTDAMIEEAKQKVMRGENPGSSFYWRTQIRNLQRNYEIEHWPKHAPKGHLAEGVGSGSA
jgi:hypothetical protein